MIITEIFKSIQGESSYAGLPCSFIRTTGCNLRCVWCDTEYAFYGGKQMTIGEIMNAIMPHECNLVELTGGEPLLQEDISELCTTLLEKQYKVLIETGGSKDISILPGEVVKIMDVKCPDSGMTGTMDWNNLDRLSPRDEIKFVINSRHDYDWAVELVNRYQLHKRNLILFSPVYRQMKAEELAQWILEDRLPVRFQIQLHKVLWGEIPGR